MTEQEYAILRQNQAAANPQPQPTTKRARGKSSEAALATGGYRSKTEGRYAAHLDLMKKAGEIQHWAYEPVTLKLAPGVRYTPDFLVIPMSGAITFHEIKGRKGSSFWSMPVSKVKIRVAASLFPFWTFSVVWPGYRLGEWQSLTIGNK